MYEVKYKNSSIPDREWSNHLGVGVKVDKFSSRNLEDILVAFNSAIYHEWPPRIYNYSLWKDGRLMAQVIEHKSDWDVFRVRFYIVDGELLDIIKSGKHRPTQIAA